MGFEFSKGNPIKHPDTEVLNYWAVWYNVYKRSQKRTKFGTKKLLYQRGEIMNFMVSRFGYYIRLIIVFTIMLATAVTIGRLSMVPTDSRTLLGFAILMILIGISIRFPNTSLFLVMIYIPFLGIVRRILIPSFGWSSSDMLVIVEPMLTLLLGSYWFYGHLFDKSVSVRDTQIFKMVRWFIFIDVLEMLNPLAGNPITGVTASIYYIVPLMWMVLSRTHFSSKWIRRVVTTVFVIGIVAAIYGIKQVYFGFFPFEEDWIKLAGFTSLHIGNVIRPMSIMDNPQEFAQYLVLAFVVGWTHILRSKVEIKFVCAIGCAVIGYALIEASVRSALVTLLLAISTMTALNAKTNRGRIILAISLSIVLTFSFHELGHIQSSSSLVSHDINGLTDPQNSSAGGHLTRALSGIVSGLKMPIGHGLASTTTAAGMFGGGQGNIGTEIDFSNMFVSDGIFGGVLYLVLSGRVFYETFKQVLHQSTNALLCLGFLIGDLGQWVNGELYSVAPIVWIMIGCVDKESFREGTHVVE